MGQNRIVNILSFLRNNFFTGITALLPIFVVCLFLNFVVNFIDDTLLNPILNVLSAQFDLQDLFYLTIAFKVIILFVIVFLIVLVGVLIKNFFVKKILHFWEGMLLKVPVVNKIYGGIQQISSVFLVKKQAVFSRAVLVEYPRKGTHVLGLVTSEAEGEVQYKTKNTIISVFIPTTPNPTSGFLIFVPQDDLINLDMSVEDSMKLIISGGAVTPPWRAVEK